MRQLPFFFEVVLWGPLCSQIWSLGSWNDWEFCNGCWCHVAVQSWFSSSSPKGCRGLHPAWPSRSEKCRCGGPAGGVSAAPTAFYSRGSSGWSWCWAPWRVFSGTDSACKLSSPPPPPPGAWPITNTSQSQENRALMEVRLTLLNYQYLWTGLLWWLLILQALINTWWVYRKPGGNQCSYIF